MGKNKPIIFCKDKTDMEIFCAVEKRSCGVVR